MIYTVKKGVLDTKFKTPFTIVLKIHFLDTLFKKLNVTSDTFILDSFSGMIFKMPFILESFNFGIFNFEIIQFKTHLLMIKFKSKKASFFV